MKPADPRQLVLAAWILSVIATLGSMRYSGIGFLGIAGLRLIPCELCWYQRILMYPLVGILGYGYFARAEAAARIGLGFAALGALVAGYHSLLQYLPHLEAGQCIVGSCSSILYRDALGLTIPNESLLAFLLIGGALAFREWLVRRAVPEE